MDVGHAVVVQNPCNDKNGYCVMASQIMGNICGLYIFCHALYGSVDRINHQHVSSNQLSYIVEDQSTSFTSMISKDIVIISLVLFE